MRYIGYILLFQSVEKMRLIGPFDDRETLSAWGRHWQNENNDDPRWHELEADQEYASNYPIPIFKR